VSNSGNGEVAHEAELDFTLFVVVLVRHHPGDFDDLDVRLSGEDQVSCSQHFISSLTYKLGCLSSPMTNTPAYWSHS
jgi:hypothetical protein